MTSRCPYRGPLSLDHALEELLRNAGTQFDHGVVSAFVEAMDDDVQRPRAAQPVKEANVSVVPRGRVELPTP